MKKSLLLSLFISFFIAIFAISFVSAQTETTDEQNADDVNQVLEELDDEEALEGVEIDEVSVPDGFGLWLRDWRERIVLALTLDPVKKAEKQMIYAEERMKIAEKILAESTSPQAQEKAQQMIEVAQRHLEKIQERKDKWADKTTERVEQLKNNLATHLLRRDAILNKLGENAPEEFEGKIEELRAKMLEHGKTFIGDIDDEEMTERTSEHLYNVRERIEKYLGAVKTYQEEKKGILDNNELSEEQKVESLQLLQEERKAELEAIRLEYKQRQEGLVEKIKNGDANAEQRSLLLRDAQRLIEQKRELIRERAEEIQGIVSEGLNEEQLRSRFEEIRAEYADKLEQFREQYEETRMLQNQVLNNRAEEEVKEAEQTRARIMENERIRQELDEEMGL